MKMSSAYRFIFIQIKLIFIRKVLHLGPGRTRANFVYFQFLASKKLAKILQVPNFGGGRIGQSCFNQNFADRHIGHKIYRREKGARVNCALDFMRKYKSSQIFLDMFLTLRFPSLRLACWRWCCLHNLRSKKIALLKPSLQIVVSNQVKETSYEHLNKNAAHIPCFH